MKSINELTKEDLASYIEDFENQSLGEYECLCCCCSRCDNDGCPPEDCIPDANNEDCFDAYKEMVMEALYESRTSWI